MKLERRKCISLAFWLALTIAVGAAIFLFSSQTAAQSNEVSKSTLRWILQLLGKSTDELLRRYNHYLRKLAHFGLYALFGFCLTGTLRHENRVPKLPAAVGFGAVFAALDEFHQHFVEGRGPQVSDVLLDTAGVFTGALVMTPILLFLNRVRMRRATA